MIFLANSPEVSAESNNDANKLTSTDVLTLLDKSSLAEKLASKDEKKSSKEVVKYVVSEGDTLASIAKSYETDWKRIFNKNSNISNPNILDPGITIIIPEGSEKLPDRVGDLQVAETQVNVEKTNTQASEQSVNTYSGGNTAGNGYAYGYCTWYAKQKRPDLPNQMGNAISWVSSAQSMGIPTGSKPKVGAIGQRGNHVVYVEKINKDGTITVSDMNYGGWAVVTTRKVAANSHYYIY
ncbi:MAG TPA: CHAP domain-containing protein [Candidatus Saccharimonadales bacterium]|nr:CHAP domain-containing protein [Candidatus Saccharimonadales bacterium]